MNDSTAFWEFARTVYAVGLLALGVVLVGLTLLFLRALPGALRVGRQLAKAITRHAKVLERDADAADTVRRVEEKLDEVSNDVKEIKGASNKINAQSSRDLERDHEVGFNDTDTGRQEPDASSEKRRPNPSALGARE